jgi:hypothetical protein
MQNLRERITFSNVIALIALFVALGGSVYAAGKISGKTIKRHSLPGNRIKRNTVTGKQVKESTLHAVPEATRADTAGTANAAFSTFHNDGIDFPDSLATIGTLNIPTAGSYAINAKFWAFNVSATDSPNDQCTLTAGADVDTQRFDTTGSPLGDTTPVPMQLVHTFTAPGSVALACTDGGVGTVQALDTKITAIEAANLTNTPF